MFKLETKNVSVNYEGRVILNSVSLGLERNSITALIGPLDCGKSAFLRLFNRLNEVMYSDCATSGSVFMDGNSLYAKEADPIEIRKKAGMVFSQAVIFPGNLIQNITIALKMQGIVKTKKLADEAERVLNQTGIWNELKDKLYTSTDNLSEGQKQIINFARVLITEPSVLLLDAPTTNLDPVYTNKIEELIHSLKTHYTLLMVTHNMHQAARLSDTTAFFHAGELIESQQSGKLFTNPKNEKTLNYLRNKAE